MNKLIVFFGFALLFLFFSSVSADVISINSGGSEGIIINPDLFIEGFFSNESIMQIDPTPLINSTDGTNQTLQNLNCYDTLLDTDGDSLNVSVKWYKNGIFDFLKDYNNSYANGTDFNATLEFGNTTKAENWSCSMKLSDRASYSNWVSSENLTILNTPPLAILDSPADNNLTINRTPEFSWTGHDDDNDTLTYDLNLTCYSSLGGGCSDDNRLITSLSSTNYVLTDYLEYLSDNNYYYNWTVRAHDGEEYGGWATPRKIEIQSQIAISLTNDVVSFGSLVMAATNNTTINNPSPFLLQNDGNAFSNITINSTSLWASIVSDSNYFKYKVDNSSEEASFNSLTSNISWTQMPITGQHIAIVELNWSEETDSAEVDLLVTVPSEEPAGNKQSTIYFTGSLAE